MKQTVSDLAAECRPAEGVRHSSIKDVRFTFRQTGRTDHFPPLLPCSIPEDSPNLPSKFSNNARLSMGRYIWERRQATVRLELCP